MGLQSLHPLDYFIVVCYFAIVIFVGLSFKKYIKQAKDYFAAGSSIPWWLAGISLWMASFSATTFVIYSELAYKYGLVSMTLAWAAVPAMFFAAWIFSKRWRRARVMTPLGFMEQRYNKTVHQIFVWTGIPLRMIDNSIRVLSTAIFVAVAVGQGWFSLDFCIFIVGIIMILYTILGGQWAVLIADFFQAIILCVAVFILLPLSLIPVGGISGFVANAPEGFFKLVSPPYHLFDWVMFSIMISMSYNATWGLVQKYNCVSTETDARKVAILMGVLSFISPIIFFIPGMAARIMLPELMNQPGGTAQAYVAISLKVMPVGLMGLLVAGMFSATLSTLGNDYNVLSGVLTKDFYNKIVNPSADEKTLVKWGRINTAIIGILTILFAIALNMVKGFNLYDIMVKGFAALGPAIMLPLIGGLFIKKINSRGAIWGVVGGTICGLGLVIIDTTLINHFKDVLPGNPVLSYWLKQGFNSISIGVDILFTMAAMWMGSIGSELTKEKQEQVDEFFERMSVPTPPAEKSYDNKSQSPFSVVGVALLMMGTALLVVGVIMKFSYGDGKAFYLNGLASGILLSIGLILWLKTRK